ncbi:MAG: hypothetical protein MI747_09315, partial [Desulfobacterales bacterium]|nr:hypothetical protein [Desulfobacterales bacterium]
AGIGPEVLQASKATACRRSGGGVQINNNLRRRLMSVQMKFFNTSIFHRNFHLHRPKPAEK